MSDISVPECCCCFICLHFRKQGSRLTHDDFEIPEVPELSKTRTVSFHASLPPSTDISDTETESDDSLQEEKVSSSSLSARATKKSKLR